jgi:acetate kinase
MKNEKKNLLILNNGSSSLKFAIFEADEKNLGQVIFEGSYSAYNDQSILVYQKNNKKSQINYSHVYSVTAAWQAIHEILAQLDIQTVGMRIVHGGSEFKKSCKLDKNVVEKISKYNHLAPLHNKQSFDLIKLVQATWPKVKIITSFDTAWFADLEPEAYLYSLPIKYYEKFGIRKYGFHGLSHEMACLYAAKKLNTKINKLSAISLHLGSGSSIAWLEAGKVKDTTMGFSPNEGLTMATRSGDLPASVALYLAQGCKMTLPEIDRLINQESGLLGLSGSADLREVLLASGYKVSGYKSSYKYTNVQRKLAKQALAVYIYDIKRYLASYLGMSKKPQAIVFTGVVGTNSSVIRNLVLKNLNLPKGCRVLIAPEGEIKNIATKTWQYLHQ